MATHWRERTRPARLEKRYEFANYDELRDFLDLAADLSESNGLYPDMGFGRDYVNMTIYPDEGKSEFSESQFDFVKRLEALKDKAAANPA